jgi:hypothetical protein
MKGIDARLPLRRNGMPAAAVIATVVLALSAAACSRSGGSPSSGSTGTSSSRPVSKQGAMLAYSRCMRTHGVTDYPDPDSHDGLPLGGPSGSDLDPDSATYQHANQACVSLLPGGAAQQQHEQAQLGAAALGFARCVRAHGISGFPDPDATGQFPETQMRGLGKGTPQFDAAQQACQPYLTTR